MCPTWADSFQRILQTGGYGMPTASEGGASSPTTIIGDFEKNSMLFLDFSTKNHYNRDK